MHVVQGYVHDMHAHAYRLQCVLLLVQLKWHIVFYLLLYKPINSIEDTCMYVELAS